MGRAEPRQEAFDNCLINYRVGEDHRVLLPQFVCQDGYFVSNIPGKVVLPEQSQVDEFLPPYDLPHPLATKRRRDQGVKIGLVKLRFVRPWPTQEVAEALSKFKAVGVVETSTSYGGAMSGGNLLHEVRASLYELPQRPLTHSFMAGLGGEMVPLKDFYFMGDIPSKAVQE